MDQRLLAAPHGFSQRATSFIASWCQGIHRTPFSCSQPREYEVCTQYSHLAQEPSNLLLRRKDLFLPICRLIPKACENKLSTETDAPSSTSILFTLLNTSGCGDLALSCLLRSDLQPARPDAPNPDSHVKRTKPAFVRRPVHARPSLGPPVKVPLNAHTICLPLRDDIASSGDPIGIEDIPMGTQWRWTVSNRRPPACKAGALPLSYTPRRHKLMKESASFLKERSKELSSTPVRDWWAREDLNLRPHAYQACALTS